MDIAGRQAEIGSQNEQALTPQARRAIWGAFIGFFVDNYDIFLPVIALAPAIAYFIPGSLSPTTAAVASAMIFATTLIGRPLGTLIFGHFADTLGRKRTTVVAVGGFGIVTLVIALLPGYERWGTAAFWCWFSGFHLAFMPLYVTGLMGMTRRLQHYDVLAWQPWLLVAEVGALVILAGIACQVVQIVVSIRHREQLRDSTGDPWNGRTLEWATASPPPAWNFAVLPRVDGLDAFWTKKQRVLAKQELPAWRQTYQPIEVPKNSPVGFVTAFFAVVTGFALIWHIWWMAGVGAIGVFLTLLVFAFRTEEEIEIPAEKIARFEQTHQAEIAV